MTPTLGEQIEALVAGELAPQAAERVLAAIATSEAAGAELEACLQFRALGACRARDLTRARAARRRLPDRTRRVALAASLAASLAAAAAVALHAVPGHAPAGGALDARFIAALAPHRLLEPRLSWPSADRHRPYDPVRARGARIEPLPFELLAGVERVHDPRASAAVAVLTGNAAGAAAALAGAADTPDLLSDRAAVALVNGNPEAAIVTTAGALARAPDHPQALWNRALALHALGLDRSAAAAFDALAARREPGWSEEALGQAAALHAWRTHHDAAWRQVSAECAAMVGGGAPPLHQVAAFSSAVRQSFYDAVRAASSADRVRALAPLANALDAAAGGDVLRRYVERIATAPFDRRRALAARYAALVRTPFDRAARVALIREVRAAHQDDLLLGLLAAGGGSGARAEAADAGTVDEYVRLALATGDPWFELSAAEQRGRAAMLHGDAAAAELTLRAAGDRCDHSGLAYLCMAIWQRLTELHDATPGAATAADALAHARRAAQAAGAVPVEDELLGRTAADVQRRQGRTAENRALVAAYRDELDHAARDH